MTIKMAARGFVFSTLVFLLIVYPGALLAQTTGSIEGLITDPQGNALPQASVSLVVGGRVLGQATTGADGRFQLPPVAPGQFEVKVEACGFRAVSRSVTVRPGVASEVRIGMEQLSALKETLTVTADVTEGDVLQPDAAMKVFASEDLLDANPGRPGAPISIPGYPIETASSGIKAPQYFAPGVASDHGEPIAMFIQVGSYLVPNNLSANR
jgi:hypothetical protein